MSADWKAVDRALRVTEPGPLSPEESQCAEFPNGRTLRGEIYLVEGVRVQEFSDGYRVALFLVGKPCFWNGVPYGSAAMNFRKIVPACDRAEIESKAEATP